MMRNPKIINMPAMRHYPDMKVILRKDFYQTFENNLKEIEKETGAAYVHHTIMKNYLEPGHRVSNF